MLTVWTHGATVSRLVNFVDTWVDETLDISTLDITVFRTNALFAKGWLEGTLWVYSSIVQACFRLVLIISSLASYAVPPDSKGTAPDSKMRLINTNNPTKPILDYMHFKTSPEC